MKNLKKKFEEKKTRGKKRLSAKSKRLGIIAPRKELKLSVDRHIIIIRKVALTLIDINNVLNKTNKYLPSV